MKRMLLVAAIALLSAGFLPNRGVVAAAPAKASSAVPAPIPAYLRPVPMDAADVSAPALLIDIPVNNTIYPPDVIAPQFTWRDQNPAATIWRVEIVFAKGHSIRAWSNGEKFQLAPVDSSLVGYVPPTLTPEQQAAHTWRPDDRTWEQIKQRSVEQTATVTISGFASQKDHDPLSTAQATFQTSKDPVGAPIFYRDVPLIPPDLSTTQRGVIKPLPDSVLPKIKWELRYINQKQSKSVMTGLPTCGNCHSFSADGKTMGIDVDGPANDKGLYALVPVKKSQHHQQRVSASTGAPSLRSTAKALRLHEPGLARRQLRRQLHRRAPCPRHPRHRPALQRLLCRTTASARSSIPPAACSPGTARRPASWRRCPVRTTPTTSRPPPSGAPTASSSSSPEPPPEIPIRPATNGRLYANDPNETQIQYDLYRIPFNDGKGGTPERIVGASENGMSNNFPKVSPDGKWIIFVQCKNGLLMRPDSKLYIVPFAGGEARPLRIQPAAHELLAHLLAQRPLARLFLQEPIALHAPLSDPHRRAGQRQPAGRRGKCHRRQPRRQHSRVRQHRPEGPRSHRHPGHRLLSRVRRGPGAAGQTQIRRSRARLEGGRRQGSHRLATLQQPGVALAATGKPAKPSSSTKRRWRSTPTVRRPTTTSAALLAEQARMDEAMAEIEKAIELNPDNGSAHINLGHVLRSRAAIATRPSKS